MRKYIEGNKDSNIIFVGEALGEQEIQSGGPFRGASGQELTRMLGEAGINRYDCFFTNVLHDRKPFNWFYKAKKAKELGVEKIGKRYPHPKLLKARRELRKELEELHPNLIVLLGDVALWAVTGKEGGITKWRGSIFQSEFGKVMPTFNPAAILKNWPTRWLTVADFRRAEREREYPEIRPNNWTFHTNLTLDESLEALECVRGKDITADIEGYGQDIKCVGFAPSKNEAFCIPFMDINNLEGYWRLPEEELIITLKIKDVFTDPSTRITWQNGMYDLQCFAEQWGYLPNISDDTMVMMHVCFPGMKKSLAVQASIFNEQYCFWKDDREDFSEKGDQEGFWNYNCEDCVRTFENKKALEECIKTYGLKEQYKEQMGLVHPLLKMMFRGFPVDTKMKTRIGGELLRSSVERHEWLEEVLGHPVNPGSNPIMKALFYTDLSMKEIKNRKTGEVTCDDNALNKIKYRQPLLRPLVEKIQEIRSIGIFKNNFVDAFVDKDDKMRFSMNITGAETFRFSCSKNIHGGGVNMQTIPIGTEKD